jgi:hypothetical protein
MKIAAILLALVITALTFSTTVAQNQSRAGGNRSAGAPRGSTTTLRPFKLTSTSVSRTRSVASSSGCATRSMPSQPSPISAT